jgi:hypothetical protein
MPYKKAQVPQTLTNDYLLRVFYSYFEHCLVLPRAPVANCSNHIKSQDCLVQSFNCYISGFISDTSTHTRILPLTFTMHFQKSTAMVLVTIVSQVLGHCVLTSITGANGVTMPGLSVIDGTPRDCARYDALSNPSLIALLTVAVLGVAQKLTHQSSARMARRWARPMGLARWMQQQP